MSSRTYVPWNTPLAIPRYGDPPKQHPYDVLILKHFPHEDVTALFAEGDFDKIYERASLLESIIEPPPQVPWPLPPPRSPEKMEQGVEAWRARALNAIRSRLISYSYDNPELEKHAHLDVSHRPSHHALLIPELVENIIRQATPITQLTAWSVCKVWQATVEFILKRQYRSYNSCSPVEHGQPVIQLQLCVQPSAQEITDTVRSIRMAAPRGLIDDNPDPFYPAYFSQSCMLPRYIYDALRQDYSGQFHLAPHLPLDPNEPQWLDLSQFKINAYLEALLPGRVCSHLGRWDIALRPGLEQHRLFHNPLTDSAFTQFVAPMYITEPPCKALVIYADLHFEKTEPRRLVRVVDTDGIKIGQLLAELQKHCNEATIPWKSALKRMEEEITLTHWTEFACRKQKDMPWNCYIAPRLMVFLEHSVPENSPTTLAEEVYKAGELGLDDSYAKQWAEVMESP
jgi:hypothetical protein